MKEVIPWDHLFVYLIFSLPLPGFWSIQQNAYNSEICNVSVRIFHSSLFVDPSNYSADISSVCSTLWRPGHVPGVSVSLRIERSIYSSVYYGIIMQCAPCEYVCVMWRKERGRKRELLMDGEAQQCVSSLNGWAWVCPYHTSVCMEYPDDITFAKYVRYWIPQFLEWRI